LPFRLKDFIDLSVYQEDILDLEERSQATFSSTKKKLSLSDILKLVKDKEAYLDFSDEEEHAELTLKRSKNHDEVVLLRKVAEAG